MPTLLGAAGLLYAVGVLALIFGLGRARRRFVLASCNAPDPLPGLLIAVAARDEADRLPGLLACLDEQEYPPGRLEVVVVDDASRDDTPARLAGFQPRHHAFRFLRQEEEPAAGSPKKRALTAALAASKAPLVLLTDADTLPPAGWARRMAAALAGGCPVVAGYSPALPRRGLRGTLVGLWDLGSAALAGAFLGLGHPLHVIGRNWGFRRELYETAGGWRGLEGALSGDDALLAQKLACFSSARRWGFSLDPATRVPTHPPVGWAHFLKQRSRHLATGKRFRPLPGLVALAGLVLLSLFWVALVTLPWSPWGAVAGLVLVLKVSADLIFLGSAAWPAGELGLLAAALPFSLAHLLLFPLLQIRATFLPFRWKGRRGR
jgi:hypothetical protein